VVELNLLFSLMNADTASLLLSIPIYRGYLTFEEVPGSDVFARQFFVLDRTNVRLEYYADANDWVVKSCFY